MILTNLLDIAQKGIVVNNCKGFILQKDIFLYWIWELTGTNCVTPSYLSVLDSSCQWNLGRMQGLIDWSHVLVLVGVWVWRERNSSEPPQSISKYDLTDSETGERPLECGVLDGQHMVTPVGGVRALVVPVNHHCMPEHLIMAPDRVSLVRIYQDSHTESTGFHFYCSQITCHRRELHWPNTGKTL